MGSPPPGTSDADSANLPQTAPRSSKARFLLRPFARAAKGLRKLLGKKRDGSKRSRRRPQAPFASLSTSMRLYNDEDDEQEEEAGQESERRALHASSALAGASMAAAPSSSFPLVLRSSYSDSSQGAMSQSLLTIGAKHLSVAGGLVNVKLYDFAIYADSHAVHASGSSLNHHHQLHQPFHLSHLTHLHGNHHLHAPRKREGPSHQPSAADAHDPLSDLAVIDRLVGRKRLMSLLTSPRGPAPSSSPFSSPDLHSTGPAAPITSSSSLPPATVLLHASRDLPLTTLQAELQRVLMARIPSTPTAATTAENDGSGGSGRGPAAAKERLSDLLAGISREHLPAHALTPSGDHIKRGGIIAFHRSGCGGSSREVIRGEAERGPAAAASSVVEGVDACRIVAEGAGKVLSSVQSDEVALALFDLFLGDEPVSVKSKSTAARSLRHLYDNPAALYGVGSHDRLVCRGPTPADCYIQLR